MHFHDITITNNIEDLSRVHDLMTDFCTRHTLSSAMAFDINVVLDELLSNIIKYGYTDDAQHEIHLRLGANAREVMVEIRDDGLPFNPLEQSAPDLNQSLAERKVGGIGLHFVRQLMDSVKYQRQGNYNHLVLSKHIAP